LYKKEKLTGTCVVKESMWYFEEDELVIKLHKMLEN